MTDSTTLTLHSTLDQLPAIARRLLQHAGEQTIWLFEGEMGAGKTTLIKALCAELGVKDLVNSPTFSLVHEYATAAGLPVYHFDFYRTQHAEEALMLDCLAYFESGNYCFIEWPTRISGLIPPAHCKISLATQPDGNRLLRMELYEPELGAFS